MDAGPDGTLVAIALMLMLALAIGFVSREVVARRGPRLAPIAVRSARREDSRRRG
jgi:hypothetical protein